MLLLCVIAATHEVGEGKTYARVSDVPIAANDLILVYPGTYHETFGIMENGVTLRGVAAADGALPIFDGQGAHVGPNSHGANRAIIRVNADNVTVENLVIRGAYWLYSNDNGAYARNASAIYAEGGSHLTFRKLEITDCNNGMFSGWETSDVLVEQCYIHHNGTATGGDIIHEHNNYTEADGIVLQYNRIGPLRDGSGGTALKDRSINTIVRYNYIEGGNRELDLVESEDATYFDANVDTPAYVYGNVLVKTDEGANPQMVHFGGDNGTGGYRRILFFYDNTLYSKRSGNTTAFFFNAPDPVIDARNNILDSSGAGANFRLLDTDTDIGLDMTIAGNTIKTGFKVSASGDIGTITGSWITLASAGFVDPAAGNYALGDGSMAKGKAIAFSTPNPAQQQYPGIARPSLLDPGAIEGCATACTAAQGGTSGPTPPSGPAGGTTSPSGGTQPGPGDGGTNPGADAMGGESGSTSQKKGCDAATGAWWALLALLANRRRVQRP